MFQGLSSLRLQYGTALLAAPLFCLIYTYTFHNKTANIYWLLYDVKSLFFLVLLYPIVEEITFRGVIQEYIASKTKKQFFFPHLSLANLLTSLLFVLIHFVHHSPIWAILVIFPSLIFGYFKEKFNNVLPSIILHIFYNFSFFSFIGK